jgi:SAM-dependent methyltransferase
VHRCGTPGPSPSAGGSTSLGETPAQKPTDCEKPDNTPQHADEERADANELGEDIGPDQDAAPRPAATIAATARRGQIWSTVGRSMKPPSTHRFHAEGRHAQRFFNRIAPLYPIVERHLLPEYRTALDRIDLSAQLSVLDLATGTGLLAGTFSERGHAVTGFDFADRLLQRARRRFPRVEFRHFDLLHLDRIDAGAFDLVSMGYVLHGLSPGLRQFVLRESARIARRHVLIFDYGHDGGWLVRFIEWIEGPNYPTFLAEDHGQALHQAALRLDRKERVSDFGSYWLCTPAGAHAVDHPT